MLEEMAIFRAKVVIAHVTVERVVLRLLTTAAACVRHVHDIFCSCVRNKVLKSPRIRNSCAFGESNDVA
jgi:hypothetical protein